MADKSILIVDDAEINRGILSEIFKEEYDVLEAENGRKALEIIATKKDKISAILLDIVMPEMDGYRLLEKLSEHKIPARIPVLMITADGSTDAERKCYEKGAADVIHKPFDPMVVKHRVLRAIELYESRRGLEQKVNDQTRVLKKQFMVLKKQEERLRETNARIIDTICTIVEFRNLESGYHLKRIKGFVQILANTAMRNYPEFGLTPHRIEVITTASAMHDIGKITVPDSILLKPGRLTADEFDIMKSHTTRGCEIVKMLADLQDKEYLEVSYDICRHHHEKYDGKGYPDGLKGEEISIAAQLTSLADVYDALVSDRVYKSAFTPSKAYEMIKNGESGIFSTKMLACFDIARPEMEAMVARTKAEEEANAAAGGAGMMSQ
ncbi:MULTISPECIES: HD domain-containing phosphohydrolase [unclassified Butyrivibrio]|uniref:HD domain-containing phosphohydrolase n=1 Tax=unclassified Butyrivibrio TaxID=2639466 RepID=UPI0003F6CEBD|nr:MULTISPECIES: HD domain-containing phosphohydrolase [unclassified Butyrivibrio]